MLLSDHSIFTQYFHETHVTLFRHSTHTSHHSLHLKLFIRSSFQFTQSQHDVYKFYIQQIGNNISACLDLFVLLCLPVNNFHYLHLRDLPNCIEMKETFLILCGFMEFKKLPIYATSLREIHIHMVVL